MGTADTHFAGIDISKDTLDACLLAPDGRTRAKRFPNTPAGFAALAAWADRHAARPVAFGMEATGPYSVGLATILHAAGRGVSVANPARVKAHAKACGQANKTDPADARAIATFYRDWSPRPWAPPSAEVRRLQALVRRRDDLRRMAAAEKNREARHDLLRGPEEPQTVRPTVGGSSAVRGLTGVTPGPAVNRRFHPLTTCHLVRR